MIKYIMAGLIISVWCWIALSYSWNPKSSFMTNLIVGLFTILILGAIHWIPFWLIFLK